MFGWTDIPVSVVSTGLGKPVTNLHVYGRKLRKEFDTATQGIFLIFFVRLPNSVLQAAKTQELSESSRGATRFMPVLPPPLGRRG